MILFVTEYQQYNETIYDVIHGPNKSDYAGRRCNTYFGKLPKTVQNFIKTANKITTRHDQFHGDEKIYEHVEKPTP